MIWLPKMNSPFLSAGDLFLNHSSIYISFWFMLPTYLKAYLQMDKLDYSLILWFFFSKWRHSLFLFPRNILKSPAALRLLNLVGTGWGFWQNQSSRVGSFLPRSASLVLGSVGPSLGCHTLLCMPGPRRSPRNSPWIWKAAIEIILLDMFLAQNYF